MRNYGPKKRTKADQRVALLMMLTMRQALDGIDVDGLVRSFGVKREDAEQMLIEEQKRRSS